MGGNYDCARTTTARELRLRENYDCATSLER